VAQTLGITVLGDYILSEGADSILENLHRIGATAVATNPTVTAEADEATGSWQPPADGGSSPRVFDRPLFGKTSLWVKGAVSFQPNAEFYADSPYSHRKPNELTKQHGHVISDFIDAAVESGLKVYMQVGSVQPSGLRDEDKPRLPNGDLDPNRMANTGSLASPAIRAYNRAYIRDIFTAYPNITGFRPDWPEYPSYTFGEVFSDFSTHVETWSKDHGIDFDLMKRDAGAFHDFLLGSLTDAHLTDFAGPDRGKYSILSFLNRFPGITEWLRCKRELSKDILLHWREAITEFGGAEKELSANAFMPPYTIWTGLDFGNTSEICNAVSPKLYTMHWAQMIQFWGTRLLEANPGLNEKLLVQALVNLTDVADHADGNAPLSDYRYPEPHEPHPIPNEPQLRKIRQVKSMLTGDADLTPLVHGYGPPDDFRRRLQLVADSDVDGIWINRYGYLGEAKLDAIADVWKNS